MCIRIPCGYSFQTISTIIAYFEIALSSSSLILVALFGTITLVASPLAMINFVENHPNVIGFNEIHDFLKISPSTQFAILALVSLYFIAGILLGKLLLSGTQRRQWKQLKIWFMVQCVCYVLRLLLFVGWLYFAKPGRRADVGLCSILINLYVAFTLTTVKYFLDEVKCESTCHRGKMTI